MQLLNQGLQCHFNDLNVWASDQMPVVIIMSMGHLQVFLPQGVVEASLSGFLSSYLNTNADQL